MTTSSGVSTQNKMATTQIESTLNDLVTSVAMATTPTMTTAIPGGAMTKQPSPKATTTDSDPEIMDTDLALELDTSEGEEEGIEGQEPRSKMDMEGEGGSTAEQLVANNR